MAFKPFKRPEGEEVGQRCLQSLLVLCAFFFSMVTLRVVDCIDFNTHMHNSCYSTGCCRSDDGRQMV